MCYFRWSDSVDFAHALIEIHKDTTLVTAELPFFPGTASRVQPPIMHHAEADQYSPGGFRIGVQSGSGSSLYACTRRRKGSRQSSRRRLSESQHHVSVASAGKKQEPFDFVAINDYDNTGSLEYRVLILRRQGLLRTRRGGVRSMRCIARRLVVAFTTI